MGRSILHLGQLDQGGPDHYTQTKSLAHSHLLISLIKGAGMKERHLDARHVGEVEAKHEVFKAGGGHETQVEDHVPEHLYKVRPHDDCLQAKAFI